MFLVARVRIFQILKGVRIGAHQRVALQKHPAPVARVAFFMEHLETGRIGMFDGPAVEKHPVLVAGVFFIRKYLETPVIDRRQGVRTLARVLVVGYPYPSAVLLLITGLAGR
jgi:hypothetical protein